jgi:hypothetical protein
VTDLLVSGIQPGTGAVTWPASGQVPVQQARGQVKSAGTGTGGHRSRQLPPLPDHRVADLSQKRMKRRPVLGGLIHEIRATYVEGLVKTCCRVLEPHRARQTNTGAPSHWTMAFAPCTRSGVLEPSYQ